MLRYAITDRAGLPGDEAARCDALVAMAGRWAVAGVEFVQLREKDLAAGALAELARQVMGVLGGTRFLVNARADVAVAVGAAGVHLPAAAGGLTPGDVRAVYAGAGLEEPVVSVACHRLAEVRAAREAGATMIVFSPVFGKALGRRMVSHGTGLEGLRAACEAAGDVPVLALGGVTRENAGDCVGAGAAGVAGIRLFAGPSGI